MKHKRHCKQNGKPSRASGFTLVEVLVALIIIAVGMLGLAKIQALAYASTGIAAGIQPGIRDARQPQLLVDGGHAVHVYRRGRHHHHGER
jgi:prepilin-type N-terminal cleavage/methylation domain-containing protein